jgi:hypothetical protein
VKSYFFASGTAIEMAFTDGTGWLKVFFITLTPPPGKIKIYNRSIECARFEGVRDQKLPLSTIED